MTTLSMLRYVYELFSTVSDTFINLYHLIKISEPSYAVRCSTFSDNALQLFPPYMPKSYDYVEKYRTSHMTIA